MKVTYYFSMNKIKNFSHFKTNKKHLTEFFFNLSHFKANKKCTSDSFSIFFHFKTNKNIWGSLLGVFFITRNIWRSLFYSFSFQNEEKLYEGLLFKRKMWSIVYFHAESNHKLLSPCRISAIPSDYEDNSFSLKDWLLICIIWFLKCLILFKVLKKTYLFVILM